MKLFSAIATALAAFGVMKALRHADHRRRTSHKEAVTRWEGEGGAIPEVQQPPANPQPAPPF
jgi:hypothetical protein